MMPLFNMLYRTYENLAQTAGISNGGGPVLPVPYHMGANIQLEIVINDKGEFISSREIPKGEGKVLIPATENSAARSSGPCAHPLCDTLPYIAGDYLNYINLDSITKAKREKEEKVLKQKHGEYIENLKKWAEDEEFSHPKVKAIYKYLSQNHTIGDLIASGKKELNGAYLSDKKLGGQPYDKVLTAFSVIIPNAPADIPAEVWRDKSLMDCFIGYLNKTQKGKRDICYISGNENITAEKHPKGIIPANYNSKLMSANDNVNFTFRGRFETSEEAYAISRDASQKIHSALTYLAAKQGVTIGSVDKRTYICWNPEGKEEGESNLIFDDFDDETLPDTQPEYKQYLHDTLSGYRNSLDITDDIVTVGLDAATSGRLSVVYYSELKAADFLERIQYWYGSCKWYFTVFENGRPKIKVKTPTLKNIIKCAYGTQKDAFLDVNDKVLKEQVQRLLFCMLDGAKIPDDMVRALVVNYSDHISYSKGNRERMLSTACAMIAKKHNDDNKNKGDEYLMELDLTNNDRSYLFGRLLAVYEAAEKSTYTKDDERTPNALKLQPAFVSHPLFIWHSLEDKMAPYFNKMNPAKRAYFKTKIGDIVSLFKDSDRPQMNRPLAADYLLGYYLQRKDLYTAKNNEEDK